MAVVPTPTADENASVPPCSMMIADEIESPGPVPPVSRLVVTNAPVILSRFSGGIPHPSSSTMSDRTGRGASCIVQRADAQTEPGLGSRFSFTAPR